MMIPDPIDRRALLLTGCWMFSPSIYREYRGDISTLHRLPYPNCPAFVEDKISRSYYNVLRGFHGDFSTTKLLACLHGEVLLALADVRPESPTFKHSHSLVLSDRDRQQILIPPGVLNAHYCLSQDCLFWYKLSAAYGGPKSQLSMRWDDSIFAVDWPTKQPILSYRDRTSPYMMTINQDILVYPTSLRPCTVVVSGYFNPLHRGHLDYIEAAAKLGDRLVVIVNNDHQVQLKGRKTFMNQDERRRLVAALKGVTEAVIAVDADTSVSLTLSRLKPDIFANGGDVPDRHHVQETKVCDDLGIKMVFGVGGVEKVQASSWLLGD